jgi:SAM-dependent methyltransferase
LRIQARFWSFAFAVVVALLAALAFGRQRSVADSALEPSAPITVATERPRLSEQFLWAALPACASALLLAVTNQLTENVAPIPFLWIVPLTLYLLSFVLCFARANLYHRPIFLRIWAVSAAGMLYALKPEYANAPMRLLLPLFAGGLFFCCVALHGEAARLKPEPRWLTRYYLLLATGGAVGGAFVAVIAPVTFSATDELPLSLAACAVLVFCALLVERRSYFYRAQKRLATAIVAVLVIGFVGATAYMLEQPVEGVRLQLRNFYGPLRVVDTDVNPLRARRELINGNINHGVQFLAPGRHMLATSYYGPQSGVAVALLSKTKHHPALRVGIIGLGAGTIATYGRAGDQYTFYEINPLVVSVAQHQFTFLRDCRAKISIVVGDARLSMMRQPPQGFDVLAVDAFTGDSIPVHLLTLQAFEQYFRHLRPDGILAVHISNSFMNLQPVLWAAAKALHKPAAVIRNGPDEAKGIFKATWVLMGADENDEEFESGMIAELGDRLNAKPQIRTWTDDYSNPLRLMVF